MQTTTLRSKNSTYRLSRQLALQFIPLALACFALAPKAQGVCQEGCDTSNNNAFLRDDALIGNTSGTSNTAVGKSALFSNTQGSNNTASGAQALMNNSIGSGNTATGIDTLMNNTEGTGNTATGVEALYSNSVGGNNTATGSLALFSNTGNNNTAIGVQALESNTTGHDNIALGMNAGFSLTTGKYNIDIGNGGVAGESRIIRIGNTGTQIKTFIAGINGATVPAGVGVIVGNNGQLGTVVSSERFKDNVQPMENASDAILSLKPVTFRYKHELDPAGIPQFGLVAEQVERVNPDLVARDDQGKPYTVRYEAVNAMLLNEFLKEHRTVQEQGATMARLEKQVELLTAGLQKVSTELELRKAAAQTALNNR